MSLFKKKNKSTDGVVDIDVNELVEKRRSPAGIPLLILNIIAINSIVNNGMFDLVLNPFIIVLFTAMREDRIYLGASKKWLVKNLMFT